MRGGRSGGGGTGKMGWCACFNGSLDSLVCTKLPGFVQVTVPEVYLYSLLVFDFSIKIMMAGKLLSLLSGAVKNWYHSFFSVR